MLLTAIEFWEALSYYSFWPDYRLGQKSIYMLADSGFVRDYFGLSKTFRFFKQGHSP